MNYVHLFQHLLYKATWDIWLHWHLDKYALYIKKGIPGKVQVEIIGGLSVIKRCWSWKLFNPVQPLPDINVDSYCHLSMHKCILLPVHPKHDLFKWILGSVNIVISSTTTKFNIYSLCIHFALFHPMSRHATSPCEHGDLRFLHPFFVLSPYSQLSPYFTHFPEKILICTKSV